jgi:hypothetical protein
MEPFFIDGDITVLCVTATSFPAGVMEAHNKLHALVPFAAGRRFYGLSRPERGVITYNAAAEEMQPGEAESLHCESIVIKKGNYISITIDDFMKDLPAIGKAFQEMLSTPGLDPLGYCVEWYLNDKDVQCMIRLGE